MRSGPQEAAPHPASLLVQPTVLHDDAPVEGESFGSGHAAIAFTAVRLIAPRLSTGATAVACALAGGTALTRVSRGAHHPVDSLAGAAMSLGIAGGLNFVVGRDHHWLSTAPVSTSALPAGPSSR